MFETRDVPAAWPIALAGILAVGLSACGSSEPIDAHLVPDEPGIYAVDNNELATRLDGTREWEVQTWDRRSRLDNDVELVVFDPSLGTAGREPVQLRRVGWVRSEIASDGSILPAEDNQWEASDDPAFQVPVRITHVAARPDVIRLTPAVPLSDGLYALRLRTATAAKNARFGVHWPDVDRRTYSSANCLDRYVGATPELRGCADQPGQILARGLKLHLVQPEKTIVNGAPALIVRGVVANTSERVRSLPVLEGQLRDASGTVLRQWQFAAAANEVPVGGSVPFKTVVQDPPAGAKNVNVSLVPTGTLGQARN
jgi:hypothetical protein